MVVDLEPILGILDLRWEYSMEWDANQAQGTIYTHTHTPSYLGAVLSQDQTKDSGAVTLEMATLLI